MKRATSKDRRKLLLRSSIPNLVAILLSLSLLLGATLAIASYIVTSPNNTIRTGTFDVSFSLLCENATELDDEQSWQPIENDMAIFNCSNWQQTSTIVEVIRVKNTGSVSIKWKAAVVPVDTQAATETGEEPDLAAVIGVYFKQVTEIPTVTTDSEKGVTTCNLDGWESAGTLRDLLNGKDWASHIVAGQDTAYVAIALQMQAGASADYLGLDASFTLKFLAVQAVASDDQWPDVNADDSSVAPADPNEPDTTAAATVTPETTSAEPETTSAEPETTSAEPDTTSSEPETTSAEPETTSVEPETTSVEPETTSVEPDTTSSEPETTSAEPAPQPTTPSEPSDPNVYKASEEGLPANTPIENTRLGQTFGVIYNGEGSGKLTDANTYQLTNGELRTATNEPYAFSVTVTDYTSLKLFVRSQNVQSMFGGKWKGDGIMVIIEPSEEATNYVYVAFTYYYHAQNDSEQSRIKKEYLTLTTDATDIITIADDGERVFILAGKTLRAVFKPSGDAPNANIATDTTVHFANKVTLVEMGYNSDIPIEGEGTTIAPTCNAQCGIVTDATVSFSEISLRPYEDVASLIADQLAQLENSGDIE